MPVLSLPKESAKGRFLSIDPSADNGGQQVLSPYHAMACNPVITIDPLGLQGQTSPGNIRSEHMVSPVWPRIPGYVDYQKKWADQYQAALEQMWADMQKRREIYAALKSGNQAQVAFATMLINHANNSKINQAKNLLAVIIDMSNASSEYVPGSGEPPIGTMLRDVEVNSTKVNKPTTIDDTDYGSDFDNWGKKAKVAAGMFIEWLTGGLGLSSGYNSFSNNEISNAFRNASKVKDARNYFYKKYHGVEDLKGASVTDFRGSFGIKELFMAGLDPIEQYVGSYDINIYYREGDDGGYLEFNITNVTSATSFFYHMSPSHTNGGVMTNTYQTYIFTEPINANKR